MKKRELLFSGVLILLVGLASFSPVGKIIYRYQAFLGCEKTDSFRISKLDFEKLIDQNLCAKDSANNILKVEGFEITYAERGLYQDSTGLPIIFTDYSNEICTGDSIPTSWKQRFKEEGYKGDTVYFDRIQVLDKGRTNICKRIKVVIQ